MLRQVKAVVGPLAVMILIAGAAMLLRLGLALGALR